jgi:hypothetical protein
LILADHPGIDHLASRPGVADLVHLGLDPALVAAADRLESIQLISFGSNLLP